MRRSDIFIDTWAWLTMADRDDPRHTEVARFYQRAATRRLPVYTSDYVLSELITLLFRRISFAKASNFIEGLLTSAERGQIRVERVTSKRFATTWEWRKRFQDKPRISFTDLSSMVIMDELGIQQVLTEDEHFMHVGRDFVRVQ